MANYDLTYEGSEVQKILDTGDELQTAGYIFRGEATPSTVPGTPTERVAYIGGAGTYNNFGTEVVVPSGSIVLFKYDGSSWSSQVFNISSNGYIYAGIAGPTTVPITGNVFYVALTAGTYTNFDSLTLTSGLNILKFNGSAWVQELIYAFETYPTQGSNCIASSGGTDTVIRSLTDIFTCSTAAATAAKTISTSYYVLRTGGCIKVTFTYANTADNATLQIGSADAKPLFFNGARASSTNSWQAGQTVEVYYDGTNYQAHVIPVVDAVPTAGSDNPVKSGGVYKQIKDLDNKFESLIFDYEAIEQTSEVDGYINDSGNIGSLAGTKVHKYDITAFTKVRITNNGRTGVLRLFAFYSSSEFSESTVVGEIGPRANRSEQDVYYIDVPENATYLGISEYTSSGGTPPLYGVAGINAGSNRFDLLQADIIERTTFNEYNELPSEQVFEKSYIKADGSIVTGQTAGFKYIKYDIRNISKIKITNTSRTGSFVLYAFYSDAEFSSSTVLGVGPKANASTSDVYIESVPVGANYLGISIYGSGVVYKAESFVEEKDLSVALYEVDKRVESLEKKTGLYAYSFDGSNLYVAYNKNGVETTYWFKKCMANELFTFYRVGYRLTDRDFPITDGIAEETGITLINRTASDNIGPLFMVTGGLVGGNHVIENGDDTYKTAKTDSFKVYADGKELVANTKGYADSMSINVENTLYDPAILPSAGAMILTTPLCSEIVTYTINKRSIEVALRQTFSSTTQNAIDNYYGMQSMFYNEDYFITPNGQFTDWMDVTQVTSHARFYKNDYPHFNRFIEKNTTLGTYQATYLFDKFGLGKHTEFPDSGNDAFMFTRGDTGKDYHHLISDGYVTPLADKVIQWRGTYTFMNAPIIDNTYLLAYVGSIGGKDALFVNTKLAYNGLVPLPAEYLLKNVSVVECYGITDADGGTDFYLGAEGVYINSASTGSLILLFD